jgi:hypothetical protein
MKKKLLLILSLSLSYFGYSTTTTVTTTNDTGIGSLRDAVTNAVSGDTITFSPNLIASGNATITLTSGEILFTTDLTIIGLITATDTLFVSGNNSSRVFDITGNIATLDKMAIINGVPSTSGGGGVFSRSNLTIKNSIIKNCHTSGFGGYGGGIYSLDSSLTLINTTVKGNSSIIYGGGIYLNRSSLAITNSQIIENNCFSSGSVYGGGISAANSSVVITDSDISNNSATSTAINNGYHNASGGAINATNSSITITNSTINENSLSSNNNIYGAGIYCFDNCNLSIDSSTISENFATAGLYSYGGGIYSRADLSITNSTISKNSITSTRSNSHAQGGGIYNFSNSGSSKTITNSTINENSAISDSSSATGGGIYSQGVSLTVTNSTINNNLVSAPLSYSSGGGIYFYSSSPTITLTLAHATIATNTVTASPTFYSHGGGVFAQGGVSLTNSTVTNNTVTDNGGGLFVSGTLTIGSSIVALNNSLVNISTSNPTNNGYNILDDVPSWAVVSDQTNIDSASLKLGVLQNNGGATETIMPGLGSVAIDMGNPSDMTDAQNGAIVATRDVGAAEYIAGNTTNMKEIQKQNINLYPNPTAGIINFNTTEKIKLITVLNSSGKLIGKYKTNQIDLSSLPNGIYVSRIETENNHFVKRFIKQ